MAKERKGKGEWREMEHGKEWEERKITK